MKRTRLPPASRALAEKWWRRSEAALMAAQQLAAVGGLWTDGYFHAGSAVEYALKAIRVRRERLTQWPGQDKGQKWHELEWLVNRIGLRTELEDACRDNRDLTAYWNTARDWKSFKRYPPHDVSEREARELLVAISNPNGVMAWLRRLYERS